MAWWDHFSAPDFSANANFAALPVTTRPRIRRYRNHPQYRVQSKRVPTPFVARSSTRRTSSGVDQRNFGYFGQNIDGVPHPFRSLSSPSEAGGHTLRGDAFYGCAITMSVGALSSTEVRESFKVSGSRAAKLSSKMTMSAPWSRARAM